MAKRRRKSEQPKVSLYEERGETSRFIDATVNKAGDLIVSGQDVGKAPREYWGDADYEFWVVVRGKHKDKVLLALIEKLYGGKFSAIEDFRELLASHEIPFDFDTWV